MIDLWNSMISSTEIINSATILSLLLAVIFFVYQEYKTTKDRAKETLRLKEEIISLIIRNEVNDNISISNINQLEIILQGFDLLKDTRLGYKTKDILKIAYTRVYENEYTNEDMRRKVLERLQNYIDEYDNSKLSINEDLYSHKHMIMTTYSVSVITIIIYTICMLINIYIQNNESNTILRFTIFFLTFVFPIASIKYLYGISSKITLKVLRVVNALKNIDSNILINIKNKIEVDSEINDLNKKVDKNTNYEDLEVVKFEDLFSGNKSVIKEIMEYRLIIETLIKKIYKNTFGDFDYRKPVILLTKDLAKKGVLNPGMIEEVRIIYTLSSEIVHEGRLIKDVMPEEILLVNMKKIANYLNEILEKNKK